MNQIFVDSSFFFALLIPNDTFHSDARLLYQSFIDGKAELIVTNFILDETYTLLRAKRNLDYALKLRDIIEKSDLFFTIVRVTKEDEDKVWDWFENDWGDLSYTDCTCFAVMKRLGLTVVATFDRHFAKAGFTILKPN